MTTHTHRLAQPHMYVQLCLDKDNTLHVTDAAGNSEHSIRGELAQAALFQATNITIAQYNELLQGRKVIVQYNET